MTLILKASEHEIDRLSRILAAAQSGSWPTFKSLSDEPFSNEDAMLEQFEHSSQIFREMNHQWDIDVGVAQLPKARGIRCLISFRHSADQPLILMLHSTNAQKDSQISIWAFYQNVDFS